MVATKPFGKNMQINIPIREELNNNPIASGWDVRIFNDSSVTEGTMIY